MAADKINVWKDDRIKKCTTFVNGTKYGYLLGVPPSGDYRATIFLIHGFPDLSMGWRYQIPALLNMGLRVVAPDCLGYGRTEAPEFSPESARRYGFKQCAADMKELAQQLGTSKIILGGHDWGGFAVYRIALHCPGFVTHVFSICTPYGPPHREYIPLDKLVATRIPFFGYQLQFVSGELEKALTTKKNIRQFLLAMYGARTSKGEVAFDVTKGALLDKLPDVQPSQKLMSEEELDYYVEEYSRNGIHGPLNWYRTREQNYKEDLGLIGRKWNIPVLFIRATNDPALRPELSQHMARYIPDLTQAEVEGAHWVLWQKPDECNAIITKWMDGVVFGERAKM